MKEITTNRIDQLQVTEKCRSKSNFAKITRGIITRGISTKWIVGK